MSWSGLQPIPEISPLGNRPHVKIIFATVGCTLDASWARDQRMIALLAGLGAHTNH